MMICVGWDSLKSAETSGFIFNAEVVGIDTTTAQEPIWNWNRPGTDLELVEMVYADSAVTRTWELYIRKWPKTVNMQNWGKQELSQELKLGGTCVYDLCIGMRGLYMWKQLWNLQTIFEHSLWGRWTPFMPQQQVPQCKRSLKDGFLCFTDVIAKEVALILRSMPIKQCELNPILTWLVKDLWCACADYHIYGKHIFRKWCFQTSISMQLSIHGSKTFARPTQH